MGDFGGLEWLVIILLVLILFGAKKIPELARGIGQGISEFRRATSDIRREIENGANGYEQNNSYNQPVQQQQQQQQQHEQNQNNAQATANTEKTEKAGKKTDSEN